MDEWLPLGLHRYRVDDSILWIETAGAFTRADLDKYVAIYEQLLATRPRPGILADVSRGLSTDPELRKRASELLRPRARAVPIALVGASLTIRTLLALFTNAHRLISGAPATTACFTSPGEAHAWLLQQVTGRSPGPSRTAQLSESKARRS